jgi:hypothetical protein
VTGSPGGAALPERVHAQVVGEIVQADVRVPPRRHRNGSARRNATVVHFASDSESPDAQPARTDVGSLDLL